MARRLARSSPRFLPRALPPAPALLPLGLASTLLSPVRVELARLAAWRSPRRIPAGSLISGLSGIRNGRRSFASPRRSLAQRPLLSLPDQFQLVPHRSPLSRH